MHSRAQYCIIKNTKNQETMLRNIIFSLLLGLSMVVHAQKIERCSYFFDKDSRSEKQILLAPSDSSITEIDVEIDASFLSVGIHLITMSFLDSKGKWSNPLSTYFTRLPDMEEQQDGMLEYWIDRDSECTKTVRFTGDELNTELDLSNVSTGMHILTLRVRDTKGCWSTPYSQFFYRGHDTSTEKNSITGYQYWIDDTNSLVTSETQSDSIITFDTDITKLHDGIHVLYMRIKDANGLWSSTESYYFVKSGSSNKLITGYRYWFNDFVDDYTLVELPEPESPYTLDLDVRTRHLIKEGEATTEQLGTITDADGTVRSAIKNKFNITFRDANGKWSPVQSDEFLALPGKERTNYAILSTPNLIAVSDTTAWNKPGTPVQVTATIDYTHEQGQKSQIYYIVDGAQTRLAAEGVPTGSKATFVMDCVFSDKVNEHTIKFFSLDEDEISSDTVIVTIPDISNSQAVSVEGVPEFATYTGNAITFENVWIKHKDAIAEEGMFDIVYHDNVNDGDAAYVAAAGHFPSIMGESHGTKFKIRSTINAEELTILKSFYNATGRAESLGWDLNKDIIYCDELSGISVYNTHITAIKLQNKSLEGIIPDDFLTLPYLKEVNLSHNKLMGDIFSDVLSPNLTIFDVSYNKFANITGSLPTYIRTRNVSHQEIDIATEFYNNQCDPDSFIASAPSMLFCNTDGTINRMPAVILYEDKERQNEIVRFTFTESKILPLSAYRGCYTKESGDTVYCVNTSTDTAIPVLFNFDKGDANIDGYVNILDIQSTISYILFKNQSPFNFTAADTYNDRNLTWEDKFLLNGNGALNIQDIIATTNIILAEDNYNVAKAKAKSTGGIDDVSDKDAVITVENGIVSIDSEYPIAAMQISTYGNLQWEFPAGISVTSKNGKMVAFSISGKTLPAGHNIIGKYTGSINLCDALLSDAQAQPISVRISHGGATDIDDMIYVHNKGDEIYGTDGLRHTELRKGVNIIKRNGTVIKMLKK